MNRSEVILELQLLPELVKQAESAYSDAVADLAWAKHRLAGRECEIMNEGRITGKNEQQRQAELWPHTEELQQEVLKLETALDKAKVEFHFYKRKLDNCQIIARLMTIL
ncbi:hypothetical protein B5M42_003940 [Paenibacillus athensensis]|uniref:Uncharacterized protein n=1 Tax=Paenibacillus athensensis TaxID=1967502 RepID=A0A4Y8PTA6_9BACL|nr:hypothetical protein [Paenibacillus athensensis]MCD1257993.1 hypothetical protein [Paenibacillus athensensis]